MSGKRKPRALTAPPQVERPHAQSKAGMYVTFGLLVLGAWLFLGICSYSQGAAPINTISTSTRNSFQLMTCIIGVLSPAVIVLVIKLFIAASRQVPHKALTDPEHYVQSQEAYLARQAAQTVTRAPEAAGPNSAGVLGAAIMGSLAWCNGPWCLLPERELSQHGVLIGASGSGKTVTLLRIVYLAARLYGYKVFFVDAKPSRQTAARFLVLMQQLGIRAAMFPRMSYNGWKGDGNAVLNRLMAVEVFSEPYYKATTKRVLNAICKPQPPKSSAEFLRRLDTLDLALVPGITAKDLGGVQNRYHAFFDSLEGQLDGGWSFDTVDAGYLLLDGTALKEEAASLGRYLVEDFGHYCTTRKPAQHKTLLIIDEYSALAQSGADTANLFERIRESGGAILVSGQGYASMGEDIERMLDAANFYIVHRSAAPEEITERAGTVKEIAETYQFGGNLDEQLHDKGRIQLEEQPAIHPNKARRLATGEAIIISHGRYVMTHVAMPPSPDENLLAQARAWIDQQPGSAPASTGQHQAQPSQPLVRQIHRPTTNQHQAQAPASQPTQPSAPMLRLPQRGNTGQQSAARPGQAPQQPPPEHL